MERKLQAMFDFQHFQQNERLARLIEETESRYGEELSDDDLGLVSAAGEIKQDIDLNKFNNNSNNI